MKYRLSLATTCESVQLNRAVRVQIHVYGQRRASFECVGEVCELWIIDKEPGSYSPETTRLMILNSPAAEAVSEAPLQNHVGNLEGDNLERHQPVEPQRCANPSTSTS